MKKEIAIAAGELTTLAETSGFQHTGRLDEVERLSGTFARTWPDAVHTFEYGRSAQGRILRALIVSRSGALSPGEIARRKIPVLMLQGGIHPGESDGKDAGFIALRELLSGASHDAVLEKIAILFVPAFNADGHERVGRWNRPNQRGPEETGWRTTAQNLNLNRDYTKADAPEMQAMLRLINEWDPLVCADLHVTDGADFEPDISIQVEPINQGAPSLRESGVQLRDALIEKLAAQDSLPLPFYPDLAKTDDPASGFLLTVYSPRFSTGYYPQRNRFTVLIETHSWKDYATRVRVMRNTVVGLAELAAMHGARWLELTRQADTETLGLAGTEVVLDYASGWREPTKAGSATDVAEAAAAHMIEFRGYAYTRKPSAISGALVTVYDPKTPQIWRVPYRDQVVPSLSIRAPRGGYIVPAGYAHEIGAKLALHGIAFERWNGLMNNTMADSASTSATSLKDVLAGGTYLKNARVETFRAEEVKFSEAPVEGCMRTTLLGQWREETRDIGAGALFVPIKQVRARLVMALLEPQAPDSFAAWGFFNACFEQKEQLEPYVAEKIAEQMLQENPDLRLEFERKLQEDPDFAASPSARLEFFLRRHSSWDERLNLYPIYRVAAL